MAAAAAAEQQQKESKEGYEKLELAEIQKGEEVVERLSALTR